MLTQKLLAAQLSHGDLLRVALLGIAAERKLQSTLIGRILSSAHVQRIEVYSRRGQGKSLFLAQFALSLAKHRAVYYASWRNIEQNLKKGDRLPAPWRIRWELNLHKAPLCRKFCTPWFVIDDFPIVEVSATARPACERFLDTLDRAGIAYILGVPIHSDTALGGDHTEWVGKEGRFELTLETNDASAIAKTWVASWGQLAGSEAAFDVDAWLQRNANRFKTHLSSMLSLLWEEFSTAFPLQCPPYLRSLLESYARLNEKGQFVIRLASFGQLIDIPLPKALIENAFPSLALASDTTWFEGLLQREEGSSVSLGYPAYWLVAPILASQVLRTDLHSREAFMTFCRDLSEKTVVRTDPTAQHYWRYVLNRMSMGWNPLLDAVDQKGVARELYQELRSKLKPPRIRDKINRIAWASTFRRLGDRERSRALYEGLWTEFRSDRKDVLFAASLLIGMKHLVQEVLHEKDYLDACVWIAGVYVPRTPRLALGLADVFIEVVRKRGPDLDQKTKSLLLGRAEKIAQWAAKTQRFEKPAYHILARLIGGLYGKYKAVNGHRRPDFKQAIRCADRSFESPLRIANDDEKKTWQDILTHHVKARILLQKFRRSGKDLDKAEWHLQRSFMGVPREDISVPRQKQVNQYLLGCLGFANFQLRFKKNAPNALDWYEDAKGFLNSLSEKEHPGERTVTLWFTRGALIAFRAALKLQDTDAILKYGKEAMEMSLRLRELARNARERASAAYRLSRILFQEGVSRESQIQLVELLAEDVAHALAHEWLGNPDNTAALRGTLALFDSFRRHVRRSDIRSVEQYVATIAKTGGETSTELKQMLAKWLAVKVRKRRPHRFNKRLLEYFLGLRELRDNRTMVRVHLTDGTRIDGRIEQVYTYDVTVQTITAERYWIPKHSVLSIEIL